MKSPNKDIIDLISEVLRTNESYCRSNSDVKGTYDEVTELLMDAIDQLMWEAKLKDWGVVFPKFAFLNYLFSVLHPLSNGIHLDFLAGNIPACFMQLRTLLEQLAKCYVADSEFPDIGFFQERLKALEDSMAYQEMSTSKLLKSLDPDAVALWGKVSNHWVHMKGFEKIVDAVAERGVPGYALVIPMYYGNEEIPDIMELGHSIKQFRALLNNTTEKWQKEVFKES